MIAYTITQIVALFTVYSCRIILSKRTTKFESLSGSVFLPANFRMLYSKVTLTVELHNYCGITELP